ncbi:MAG: glycoside hydrolase family 3 C-terminal domain-containing protein [Bacteroidaceae bacterium]|nr:glycoside hydrolase family 3 C-terminal domain-containing protein [Bacteroidaceae bacterium]
MMDSTDRIKRILVRIALLASVIMVSCKERPAIGKTPIARIVREMTLQEKASLLTVALNSGGYPDSTAAIPRFGIPSLRFGAVSNMDSDEFNQLLRSYNLDLAFSYGQRLSLELRLERPGEPEPVFFDATAWADSIFDISSNEKMLRFDMLRSIALGMTEMGTIAAVVNSEPEEKGYAGFFGSGLLNLAVSDRTEQVLASVLSGNDLFACRSSNAADAIVSAVSEGVLDVTILDRKVVNFLDCLSRYVSGIRKPVELPDLVSEPGFLKRETAVQSAVLIKNDNVLPLEKDELIALYGLAAYNDVYAFDSVVRKLGNRLEPSVCNMYRHLASLPDSLAQKESLNRKPFQLRADAVLSDVAVIVIQGNVDGNSELIRTVCGAFHFKSRNVILVMDEEACSSVGSSYMMADAVILTSFSGKETSDVVSQILNGSLNPSGRLSSQLPGGQGRYRTGVGLGYSSFVLSKPDVQLVGNLMKASVRVTNTGMVPGMESVLALVCHAENIDETHYVGMVKTAQIESGDYCTVEFPIGRVTTQNEELNIYFQFPDGSGTVSTFIPVLR